MLKIQNGVKEEKEAGGDEKPQHASPPAPPSADPCQPTKKAEVKEDDLTRQPQGPTPPR
jgi:hypothetical protein